MAEGESSGLPRNVLIFGVLILILGLGLWFGLGTDRAGQTGGGISIAELDATFTETDGTPAKFSTLIGRPTAIFYGYTHCPDICPMTLSNMSEIVSQMGPKADQFSFMFVSIDPDRDTPELLAEYMTAFDPKIKALSSDDQAVSALKEKLDIYAEKVPSTTDGEYTVDHSAFVYVYDAKGVFVDKVNVMVADNTLPAVLDKL